MSSRSLRDSTSSSDVPRLEAEVFILVLNGLTRRPATAASSRLHHRLRSLGGDESHIDGDAFGQSLEHVESGGSSCLKDEKKTATLLERGGSETVR